MTYSTLMVHLTLGVSNEALLRLTADMAGRLKAREVIGIAACQPLQVYDEGALYLSPDIIEQDRAEMEKELKAAEARFRDVLQGKAPELEWRSTVSYSLLADYIAQQMRAADLLITGPDPGGSVLDSTRRVSVADLVMRVGRPVLVVEPETDQLNLDNVVVGWKDSREARRALEDALPLLKMARRVTVVEIALDEEIPAARGRLADIVAWLKRHDISAEAQAASSIGDDATRLGAIAQTLGAGLLVAGAYGHNRLREWVLGGVTRDLLLRPSRCSFVSH